MADQPYVDGVPLTKPSKTCTMLAQFCVVWALNLLVCIALLHGAFVGSPGCIGAALTDLAATTAKNATTPPPAPALAQQPPQRWLVGQRPRLEQQQQQQQQQQPAAAGSTAAAPPPPPLGMEDVLQIKIVPGGSPEAAKKGGRGWIFNLNLFPGLDGVDADAAAAAAGVPPSGSGSGKGGGKGGGGNATAQGDDDFQPHYVFTQNAPLLYLDAAFLARHAVQRVNLTVDEACISKGYGGLLRFVCGEPKYAGLDTVVINSLMASLRSDGFLRVGLGIGFGVCVAM